MNHKTCQNTEGGFACVCVAGFALNDITGECQDKFWNICCMTLLFSSSKLVHIGNKNAFQ